MSRTSKLASIVLSTAANQNLPIRNPYIVSPLNGGKSVDYSEFAILGQFGLKAVTTLTAKATTEPTLLNLKLQLRGTVGLLKKICEDAHLPFPSSTADLSEFMVLSLLKRVGEDEVWWEATRVDMAARIANYLRRLVGNR